MKKIMQLKLLTLCICVAQQSFALELIEDQELSRVTGQDGMTIGHEISRLEIDQANWYDPNGKTNIKTGLGLHNVKMNGVDNQNINSSLSIDVGATDQSAGLGISASISPFVASADLNLLKTLCTSDPCSQESKSIRIDGAQNLVSLGKLSLSTSSALNWNLKTSAGLFNKDAEAEVGFQLQNATLSHTLGNNKLILNDFNFNFAGIGYMYIDSKEGLVLSSYSGGKDHIVDLDRVADSSDIKDGRIDATNPGVNIDLRYASTEGERRNIIRLGASGAVTKAKIAINADQTNLAVFDRYDPLSNTRSDTTATGYNKNEAVQGVSGDAGLHLQMAADFLNAESLVGENTRHKATTVEIGHTGKGSYAVEFSNLRALTKVNGSGEAVNASIDFGDLYINSINASSLNFLINKKLSETLRMPKVAGNYLTFSDNMTQSLLGSPSNDYILVAIRGMDFQSIAAKAQFISDNSLEKLPDNTGTWGIGIPIYNLNSNIALTSATYKEKQALAYNLMASTEGYGIDKKTNTPSTTSLLLIDGHTGAFSQEAVNYYMGLRNIDAFIESNGVISYEDEGILISAEKLLIAANAEWAVGQLPGAKYNCEDSRCLSKVVPDDIFSKKSDVLTSIAFKLDGKGDLMIIPGLETDAAAENQTQNFLSLNANFIFNTPTADVSDLGSYIGLSNEDDVGGIIKKSSINLNRMQGEIGLNSQIYLKAKAAVLDSQVKFNNKAVREGGRGTPFTAEVALSPSGLTMQKVADLAITGGTLRSTMMITPR